MSKYPIKQLVMARVAGLIAKRHFDGKYPLCVTMDEIMNGEHDFTREEAMHYADTLDRFFSRAWKEFFGY